MRFRLSPFVIVSVLGLITQYAQGAGALVTLKKIQETYAETVMPSPPPNGIQPPDIVSKYSEYSPFVLKTLEKCAADMFDRHTSEAAKPGSAQETKEMHEKRAMRWKIERDLLHELLTLAREARYSPSDDSYMLVFRKLATYHKYMATDRIIRYPRDDIHEDYIIENRAAHLERVKLYEAAAKEPFPCSIMIPEDPKKPATFISAVSYKDVLDRLGGMPALIPKEISGRVSY